MTDSNAILLQIGDIIDSEEFGRLRVVDIIGSGGMGTVYEVERINSTRRYALKAMNPALITPEVEGRFRREADIMGRLNNTRIVKIHAYFRSKPQGIPCIVMDRLHGMTLSRIVRQGTRVNLAEVCTIASDLLGVLDYIHGLDVVHRDIKPDNIFLQKVGTNETLLTLIDFGIFKDLIESGKLADAGFIGTPRYAAPEQLEGRIVTPRTDLHAAGVVFYELLTGKHPYGVGMKHLLDPNRKPVPLLTLAPETPLPIVQVITAALERDPEKRPESANDFARPFRRHTKELTRARSSTGNNNSSVDGDLFTNLASAGAASASPTPVDLSGPTGTVRIAVAELRPAAGAPAIPAPPAPPLAIVPTLPSARDPSPREPAECRPEEAVVVVASPSPSELVEPRPVVLVASSPPPELERGEDPISPSPQKSLAATTATTEKGLSSIAELLSPGSPPESDDRFEQPYAGLEESFRIANSEKDEAPAPPTLEGTSSSAWRSNVPAPAVVTFLALAVLALAIVFGGLWAFKRAPATSARESSPPVPLVTSAATTTTRLVISPPVPPATSAAVAPTAGPLPQPPAVSSAPPARVARPAVPRQTHKDQSNEDTSGHLTTHDDDKPPAVKPRDLSGLDDLNTQIRR